MYNTTFRHIVCKLLPAWAGILLLCLQLSAQQARNPIIFADVPDMAMVRVGDTYYMSSTTMHMSPGVPIMKSKDLSNWELVGYCYDTLADVPALTLSDGKGTYGRGSWASCIRYHQGRFYVSTFSQTTNQTYIYHTDNIEQGPWQRIAFSPSLHDHTLFFDETDGKAYMIYGGGKLHIVELRPDLNGLQPGGLQRVLIENASAPGEVPGRRGGLGAEGSQLFKVHGMYYLFNISWPPGGMRTVLIHRAASLQGPWEGRVALQDKGVAQGGLIDMPDGRWFAYLFQDHGAVGRIPYLVPVQWQDGWPVLGEAGKVPEVLDLPAGVGLIPGIVASDEFARKKGDTPLPLVWQWNHNPNPILWSLQQRKGYLRLSTGRIDSSWMLAQNTLTQRTIGPLCTGQTALEVKGMLPGDFAGLGLLQKNYGQVGVQATDKGKYIVMVHAGQGTPEVLAEIPFHSRRVYLKVQCDFTNRKDTAHFFYSLNGTAWTPIGQPLKMSYTLPHFMGYRFGLFYYATRQPGGYADFDYFRIAPAHE